MQINNSPDLVWSPSDFAAVLNQTLEYAYPTVQIEGEVANFKVNQNKFVFFDLKDQTASLSCFMMLFNLRQPLVDGMRVLVQAQARLTDKGKFSLTINHLQLRGEGSIKQAAEQLRRKLAQEGLFDLSRKRALPSLPTRIGLISSEQAAGYADFMRILNERWGGLKIYFKQCLVQGMEAPDAIIKALLQLNQLAPPLDLIVIVRGGGSAEDLAAFNDEALVRAVANSRLPVLVGIGHEVDHNLVDLAADQVAATPTHAAQLLTPERGLLSDTYRQRIKQLTTWLKQHISEYMNELDARLSRLNRVWQGRLDELERELMQRQALLRSYDPYLVLQRGYAILHGAVVPGQTLLIETAQQLINTEVKHVQSKK